MMDEPFIDGNRIKVQAQGTRPLLYQWYKNGRKLRDDDDYQGSSSSELVILGMGLHIKAEYNCCVVNKCGEISSQQVLFGRLHINHVYHSLFLQLVIPDPFTRELRQRGLREYEIKKLTGE